MAPGANERDRLGWYDARRNGAIASHTAPETHAGDALVDS